jgi:hypothetical protein
VVVNMAGLGESTLVGVVILIAVVLAMAAAFMIYAMGNFNRSAALASLAQAEAFMTNVADDVEASMYVPGTVLVYALPTTGYGVFNLVSGFCTISINGTTYGSGAVVYGVPPRLVSYQGGFIDVIRGGGANGLPSSTNESTIVLNPAAPLISIVQFGYGQLNGVTYGTYIAMFPRLMAISSGSNTYIYIPMINVKPSSFRTGLNINVTNVYTMTLPTKSSFTISDSCGPFNNSYTIPGGGVVTLVFINMTVTFR